MGDHDVSAFACTTEQTAAIEHDLSPLLIVAGAGTGKTTVIAERVCRLVSSGIVRDDQVLALTFSNKAEAKLETEVRRRLPGSDVTVSTYHSYGASLVADHALELGIGPDAVLLNPAQSWQLLFAVYDEFRFVHRKVLAAPGLALRAALALASRCADHLVGVAAVAEDCQHVMANGRWAPMRAAARMRAELCQVMAAYERRKRERDLIDFGDQVALAVRLLHDHPDVAAGCRDRHPVLLLDEYQDTNFAQRRMLQLIYPPGSAITAVGDDMQAIYLFRGAHLANIQRFEVHFPPVTVQRLQTTFRFGPELVELANRIQGQVRETRPKGLVAVAGAASTTIQCFLAADEAEEAQTIADDIAGAGSPWHASAVLCRKRRLIGPVVAALETGGVPVEVVGASGLLDRPEIVDLVSWLEVVADPTATVALLRILMGPALRIGFGDLAALATHVRERRHAGDANSAVMADGLRDLATVAGLSDEARRRLDRFAASRQRLALAAGRLPILDLIETVIDDVGLWRAAGERGRENLLRFCDLAGRFAPVDGEPGLPAFLEYLQLLDETEEDLAEAHPTDEDSVKVMTIHQAKGLEFDRVYVPGLAGSAGSSRIFPDPRGGENALTNSSALPWWLREDDDGLPDWRTVGRSSDIDDVIRQRKLDEEWRLFYVACTRARRRLVCSAAHWYEGPSTPQGPSRFYEFVASQTELVTERFRHGPAATDPAVAARLRRRADADRYAAVVTAQADGASDQLVLDGTACGEAATSAARDAPPALSVTNLVTYARCPKQFYWSVVRPLPRRSTPAARLGTHVHHWIEQRSGVQLTLTEADGDAGLGTDAGPGVLAGLQASFLATPFADLRPVRVESPFVLALGHHLVRGRVDAVYERDRRLELVDFKTGRASDPGEGGASTQLDVYGLAAVEAWSVEPAQVRTTYCYLRTDADPILVSQDWSPTTVERVRAELQATLDAIARRRYAPVAGSWCERCDFLAACAAGRAALRDPAPQPR